MKATGGIICEVSGLEETLEETKRRAR
jgi:hypothetical protein